MPAAAADPLLQALSPSPGPVLVGFSGGLDSSVLLHALAAVPGQRQAGLRAIHVDHGLQPAAANWAEHCRHICAGLALELDVVRVQVDTAAGLGLEAAARQARRRAFAAALRPGERLALAHHRDDQAETFLLRALRASGPDALGAMQPLVAFATGWLWRPLLTLPRACLRDWAEAHALHWIDDPSNADPRLDRNFLRHHVLPLLRQRWPQADAALATSAGLCAQAGVLLQQEDQALLAAATMADGSLAVARLAALPPARQARLLRRWLTVAAAPPLPASGIAPLQALIARRPSDAEAGFAWQGHAVRRWHDALHLLRLPLPALPADWSASWDGHAPLALPDGGRLMLEIPTNEGFGQPLTVRARRGGERIVLPGRTHSHPLKQALQDAGIPPWQRTRLPLLCDPQTPERVLAAGPLLSEQLAAWLQARGAHLHWKPN